MNDNEIQGREDLLNDTTCHCGECHKVVPVSECTSIDGYLYCYGCSGDFESIENGIAPVSEW